MTDAELRVSDAERRQVADALSEHYADGRLDETELNERLGAAMAAKTRSDLAPLLVDLPRRGDPEPPAPRPRRAAHLLILAIAFLFATSLAASFLRPDVPWVWIGLFVLLLGRRRQRHARPIGERVDPSGSSWPGFHW